MVRKAQHLYLQERIYNQLIVRASQAAFLVNLPEKSISLCSPNAGKAECHSGLRITSWRDGVGRVAPKIDALNKEGHDGMRKSVIEKPKTILQGHK